jgi:hypothetical protein
VPVLVKRSSWHYRLINFYYNDKYKPDHPVLCKYFWTVVLFSVITVVISPFLLGALVVMGINGGYRHFFPKDEEKAAEKKLLKAREKIQKEDAREAKRLERDLYKEPSLLRSFLRAKKDKVCPLIEFVDEEPTS